MADTETLPDLLALALQDLCAGCDAFADRLPGIAAHARDARLVEQLGELGHDARARGDRLRATGCADGGPENLWMAGILDDATRDTRSIAAGPPLDLAMVGAMRKAIAAEAVSVDTALALAARLDREEIRAALAANRAGLAAADARLAALLGAIGG